MFMGIEYEWKFRATPAQLSAAEAAVTGQTRYFQMHTIYYDTPSGRLSARRYTLRRRMENSDSICALKTPDEDGRREWEVKCDRIEDAIDLLCKLGAPEALRSLTDEGLVALCGAKFTRIARTVSLPDCTVELALDRGCLTGGGREVPLCEVEVELKSGTPQAAAAYAARLAVLYGLQPEKGSKFRRALALAKGEENG
jgi:inorganic triphosphatase YgiF